MVKEFDAMQKVDEEEVNEEEVNEAQSPAQKAAFAKMLAAKDGKKDEAVEETVEETEEAIDESVEEVVETEELNEIGRTLEDEKARLARLEKQQEKMKHDEMEVKRLQDIIDQAKKNIANNMNESELKEDCGCGHGSDCDCGPDCGCGCNESVTEEVEAVTIQDAVNESQERLKYLVSR